MRQMDLGKIVLLVVGSFIPVGLYAWQARVTVLTALFSEASLPYLLVDCGFLAIQLPRTFKLFLLLGGNAVKYLWWFLQKYDSIKYSLVKPEPFLTKECLVVYGVHMVDLKFPWFSFQLLWKGQSMDLSWCSLPLNHWDSADIGQLPLLAYPHFWYQACQFFILLLSQDALYT